MTWLIIGLVWFVISLVAGLSLMRVPTDELGAAPQGSKRGTQFLIGFFGWPLLACFLIFILVYFWDLLLADEDCWSSRKPDRPA